MAWTEVRKVSDRAGLNGMDDGGLRKEGDSGSHGHAHHGSRLEQTNPFMRVARHGVCLAGQSDRQRVYTRTDTVDSNGVKSNHAEKNE